MQSQGEEANGSAWGGSSGTEVRRWGVVALRLRGTHTVKLGHNIVVLPGRNPGSSIPMI